ncbi:MAG: ATP-dependent protease subunit HslV [Dehalobacterium sp.]|jgi:ATP-dependent HslUV protease subunit HslV
MFHGTTIVAVRRGNQVAVAGDGQVTLGNSIAMKHGAKKVRKINHGQVVTGFAGSVADAFTLLGKFETKLEEYRGNLPRAAVELAKEWRMDKYMRQLEAMLIVADKENLLVLSGTGEVIEPDDNITAVGSGGPYALAAARALSTHTEMEPRAIVEEALRIAAEICVYTNHNITIEEL